MSAFKILFINLGYARGISGSLAEHFRYGYRHLYCPPDIQHKSLQQLNTLIHQQNPDLCCIVEIDQGSFGTAGLNQLHVLIDENYTFYDVENKYGPNSHLRSFVFTSGKSNAFLARKKFQFEKIFFKSGVKRLIYKLHPNPGLTVFFAHFSLNKATRTLQILEARDLLKGVEGEVVFLGDFNILAGLQEITPLLDGGRFVLLNREQEHTFLFYNRRLVLDLCVCSASLSEKSLLQVIPLPYSDHAALLLDIRA